MTNADDAEVQALAAFQAKTTRWRKAIGIPFVVVALIGAILGYFQVEAWLIGADMPTRGPLPLLMHGVGALLPFAAFLAAGIFTARAVTNARREAWLTELAKAHRIDAASLIESSQIFD